MINIFEEITWPQFSKMGHISKLPLQEQIKHYNQYIYQLEDARMSWITYQNKGPKPLTIQNVGFLLQEDLFDLEQEDGNKIFITDYA
jgi:hypothetical protein